MIRKGRKKATPRRPEQVAETIRQIISGMLVQGEIRDPRVSAVAITVTSVKVAPDLSFARVWVALSGGKADQETAVEGLQNAAGFIRTRLAQELTTYTAPEVRFVRDQGAEHGARIDQILAELKRTDAQGVQDAHAVDGPDGAGDAD